jgi:hypothetical protein
VSKMWFRKHFRIFRPKSQWKKNQIVWYNGKWYKVVDNRIDHCGQILVTDMRQKVYINPDKFSGFQE